MTEGLMWKRYRKEEEEVKRIKEINKRLIVDYLADKKFVELTSDDRLVRAYHWYEERYRHLCNLHGKGVLNDEEFKSRVESIPKKFRL